MSAAPSQDARADWDKICCPICAGTSFEHLFEKAGEPFVRCLECRLTLINPRPPFSAIRAGYDAGYSAIYTKKAAKKLRRARRRVHRLRRKFVAGSRWLDVGCSAGFVVRAAQDAGFDAHGVDIENAAITYGQETLGLNQLKVGLLHEQAYPAGHFHVLSAYDVIEHVPDLNAFVAELKRILHPDGVIDLGTPDIGHWRVPRALATWPEFKPSEHLYYFDRTTLARLMNNNGLRIERVRLALKPGLKVLLRHL
jgi:2-polyprenyl-3-methyl-5-hydroxy-6-metoxy-1,4-benzoquinol methylase